MMRKIANAIVIAWCTCFMVGTLHGADTVDLALRLTTLVTNKKAVGQEIKYTVTIINQGNVPTTNMGIINYIPNFMELSASNPNGWFLGAGNTTAAKTITSFLLPGDSVKTDIYLVVKAGASGLIKNTAEITAIQDTNYINVSLDEIDSTPDGFNTEVIVKDNVINENAKLNINLYDEDDHDIAYITVLPDVFGYESVKLTTDYNSDGLVTVGDIVTYTITYVNYANASTNFQITNALPSSVRRKGTITASGTNTSGLSLNSSYDGTGNNNLLNSGVTLGLDGKVVINIPIEVRGSGSGQTLSNQSSASGGGITGSILSDAVDNGGCPAPPNVSVPSGSISQPCTSALDPVFFSVSVGSPLLKAFESAKLTKDSDGNGVPSVGDTLTYSIYFYNVGTANVSDFQINNAIHSGLTRSGAGPISMSYNNGSTASLNGAFNGTSNTNLLGAGTILEADTGFIKIMLPVKVLVDAESLTIGNISIGTGTGITSVTTDAADNSTVGNCVAPSWAGIPSGSLLQNFCSASLNDSTFVSILPGTPVVQRYKTVRWLPSSQNGTGLPAVHDTLLYTIACFNTGTAHLTGFQITDTLPFGVQRIGISNLSATSGTNAAFNSNFPTTSYQILKQSDTTKPISLKAGGYLYVNVRVLVLSSASGLLLSNQASITGNSISALRTDAKDSITAPAILIDPARAELRTNVLKSYLQNNQTGGQDPTLIAISVDLPVELVGFWATEKSNAIQLTWEVQHEHLWGYELEKSRDGIQFVKVSDHSARNLASTQHYSYLDQRPFPGVNYYRLKIVEKDARTDYSRVVQCFSTNVPNIGLTVYPNPAFSPNFTLQLDNAVEGIFAVKVFDQYGILLYQRELKATSGSLNAAIELDANVSSGPLQVVATDSNGRIYSSKLLYIKE